MAELEFGVNLPTSAAPGVDPVARAQAAERLGYDFISSSDHPSGTEPTFETWTMLAWVAASTSRIRIATRVLGVPYRSPAMVAKMAESLHRLSGGRLILGLGGGYSDEEFRAFGLTVPTPREKVDGLEEAIRIAHGLWSERAFTFAGAIHRTERAPMEPKPDQHIPIWLGTLGPRALNLTGRLADGWIPSLGNAAPERVPELREHIRRGAAEVGRDPREITFAYNVPVRVGPAEGLGPDVVSGSADAVTARLLEFVDLGFTAFNVMPAGPGPDEQVERFAAEVLPALRRAR